MFRIILICTAAILLSCTAACGTEFSISDQFSKAHPITQALYVFADKLSELTNATLKARIVDSGALYTDAQIIEALQDGQIEAGVVGINKWGGMVPPAEVFDLPFLFRSLQAPGKFIESGAGALLDAEFVQNGVKNIFWLDYGFVQFWNNVHPLRKQADFTGLPLRTFSACDAATLAALGAVPTMMSSSDVMKALDTGRVVGATTGISAGLQRGLHKECRYLTIANYCSSEFSVQANFKWYNSLMPFYQKALLEAGKYAELWLRKNLEIFDSHAADQARRTGIEINVLTPAERDELAKATQSVWQSYLRRSDETGKKLLDLALQCQ
ncbi:MAG: TRAP transporter substrate-binding protein DctP [Pyramidobacter sp.]